MASNDSNDDSPANDAEVPIVAKLVDDDAGSANNPAETETQEIFAGESADGPQTGTPIRVGSPFAVDPQSIAGTTIQVRRSKPEAIYDVGPLRYTAMGAVAAATLVLGFAAAAAWWFPGGGTIIAALGCALSVFGLYSNKKKIASACLMLHLLLFMISYSRAITV